MGKLQAWTIDQTGWKERRTVPALAARSILFLKTNLAALTGGDEHGGVHVEHVIGGRGRLHWGRDSSGFLQFFESHRLYHYLQLKQKEEEGGFELTVAQVSWLGQFYIFATQMQKNVSKHIFS